MLLTQSVFFDGTPGSPARDDPMRCWPCRGPRRNARAIAYSGQLP